MENIILTLALALVLTACGNSSEGDSAAPIANVDAKSEAPNEGVIQSIAVAKVSDLPECSEANDTQLGYVKADKQFYVCESASWNEISIEDGEDGSDGVTTVKEIEATNKKNQWVDPITGLSWLLGGGGDYDQAVAACSGAYRLPTWDEAVAGINHGVRGIAASVPVGQNFWIDVPGQYWYATETASAPNKFQVLATAAYNVYCVK